MSLSGSGNWYQFFRCANCGKLHTRGFVQVTTVCTCGVSLWPQARLYVPDR